jgi:hypothetical protein
LFCSHQLTGLDQPLDLLEHVALAGEAGAPQGIV